MPTTPIKALLPVLAFLLAIRSSSAAPDLVGTDIGGPAIAGSMTAAAGGYDIVGGGTNIFGASDQFFFAYQEVTGDFDYRTRVGSLSRSDIWAKCGLMARETLVSTGRHASVFATPNVSGTFFSFRSATAGATINTGSFPPAYPNTWLRLKRSGTNFTGYAGVDGQTWVLLGSVPLNAPSNTFYLGLAVTAASATRSATAEFREAGEVTSGTVGNVEIPFEPLGPSSRKTGLLISEFMYHPRQTSALEFIELFNAGLIDEDLSGYRLSSSIDYSFPSNTVLKAGDLLVVARNPAMLQQVYGAFPPGTLLGPWVGSDTNGLPDDTGRIRLRNPGNAVVLEINYQGGGVWPVAADGSGHSLVLARPSYGEDDVRAWSLSEQIGGSPGRLEPYTPDSMRHVVINEFFANSDPPAEDFIELYNASSQPVDISGAYLSDDRDTNRFRIPADTVLPPGGFISFSETALGFGLSSHGERIYLVNSNQSRVIDALAFDAQALGIARGRYPDGSTRFSELASRTPGTNNSPALVRPIVINEIMFHPISDNEDDEYVELYNRSTNAVDVSGWRMLAGIDFTFAPNTIIAPNGSLVLARSKTNLLAKYAQLNAGNTVGDYDGALANGGERLALAMPEYSINPDDQTLITDYVVVNEITYRDEGRWSQWADGGGSSLELIDPNSDNRLMANWIDSDETGKSAWTNVVHFDLLDNVYPVDSAGATLNEVQVMLLNRGEALLDDLGVHSETSSTGPNLVANGTFTSGLGGWLIQGNHVRTGLEPVGPNNPSQSLHLRASAGGDNGANRIETDLTTTLAANSRASVRCKLRWLRGHRDVLLRLHGGGLDAVVTLPVPNNLGTPGLGNSRLLSNAGPAIDEVTHSPVLPAANETVIIRARVNDPDGIADVQLVYRVDPSSALTNVVMTDDGISGDALAGDGIYTCAMPGRAAGALVAFRVTATDARLGGAASAQFPSDAPARECLVRFGEVQPAGNLGIYRLWMTAANITTWNNRERLSNEALDGTFVANNYRVIYNATARYRGSPFVRPGYTGPTGSACGYVWAMPSDDFYLGDDEFNLDSLEPAGRDSTALREVTSFTILDYLNLPSSYQRFVHVVINGINNTSRSIPIYADSQQPSSKYITAWFPDEDDGELFKIDDWFEFDDTPTRQSNKSASLQNFTSTGGVKDKGRYRWSWEKKVNRGLNDDYSALFKAVDALSVPTNLGPAYVSAVESAFDIEEWLSTLAFRHVIGDWDGYGYRRGKNQFCYFAPDGKWRMLMWDLDFSLGCTGGDGPTQDLFNLSLGGDSASDHMPEVANLYNFPHFRRIYLGALHRMATGPLQDAVFLPTLDARYRALQAHAIVAVSPYVGSGAQGISIPAWIQQRRTNILQLVARMTNQFAVSSPALITTNGQLVTVSGYAPLFVKQVLVNGIAYPVTWTTVTNWTARLVPADPTNVYLFAGMDLRGNVVTSTQSVTVTYTGPPAISPEGKVVFNEIMYHPTAPGISFVELYNTSTSVFDLSGWRINGLGYTFPPGSILTNGQYLVLAKTRTGFAASYSNSVPVFGEFDGNLDLDGETLTLIKPGQTPAEDVVVNKVRYEPGAPWPGGASSAGFALQLIDASQDNSRASNWSGENNWRRLVYTGILRGSTNQSAQGTNLFLIPDSAAEFYVDDFSLVQGSVPEAGANVLENGGFEEPLAGNWIIPPGVMSNSTVTTDVKHSGNASLQIVSSGSIGSLGQSIQNIFPGNTNDLTYTLSLWFLPTLNGNRLTARVFSGASFTTNFSIRPVLATPGASNNVVAPLPQYPALWLNEIQPQNFSGITDMTGTPEPWAELYNGGSNDISLDNYYLSDTYTNLAKWAFPAGTTIAPGHKLIWLDGQPGEGGELHTSFRLEATTGSLVLSRLTNDQIQVVDYLNFSDLGFDTSYGDLPDGQPFARQVFYAPTPRATNVAPPVSIFINEWMASNQGSVTDPADGRADDWFELFNGGALPVDVSRYTLADDTSQFRIPNGTVIPPHDYLLVWADNDTDQNGFNGDVHASFQLNRTLDAIALYDPDGTLIDYVAFTNQIPDVSQGRYPDGTATIQFLGVPTPRGPNTLGSNAAPVISAIPDINITAGQTVTFTVGALDPDTPLSFSLNSPPPGATIDPNSGLFSWPVQTPATNQITVQVTDSGSPPLSASRTFTVRVYPPARAAITINSGQVSLSFNTLAGRQYRVDYADTLAPEPVTWHPLAAPFTASGSRTTIQDNVGANEQRFYRIVQDP